MDEPLRITQLLRTLLAIAVTLVFLDSLPRCHAVAIDWVTVGDPGNVADTSGDPNPAGYVADSFRIMKYEFTNSQYTVFLNSVAATDIYGLYNTDMGIDARGGIARTGSAGNYSYSVRDNMGDKPVNYVTWFDAARVANWLQNGANGSASTETGAYTLAGATSGIAPAKNALAAYYIPTEDQWYKAAYYKGSGTNAGYWDYGTQSDAVPTAVTAGSTGIGAAGNTGNFANYSLGADWNGQDGNVTTVGTNGGPSAYGAFDMSGNVNEWNDLTGTADSARGLRGGGVINGPGFLSSSGRFVYTFYEAFNAGFRLASPVSGPSGVPEIDGSGARQAMVLIVCGLALLERRRQGR